jgi:hypothetical protein
MMMLDAFDFGTECPERYAGAYAGKEFGSSSLAVNLSDSFSPPSMVYRKSPEKANEEAVFGQNDCDVGRKYLWGWWTVGITKS